MNNKSLSLTSRIQRRADVLFSPIDRDILALDEISGRCYSLNEVSGQIWQWLETPQLISDLCARLLEIYEVDGDICAREVLAVLEGLKEVGLVEVITDAA